MSARSAASPGAGVATASTAWSGVRASSIANSCSRPTRSIMRRLRHYG
ncbi:MAG: hypothetical protein QM820_21635 [Minicystis sp.]